MFLIDVFFQTQPNFTHDTQVYAINQIVEQWRYNGQIIGREIPLFVAQLDEQSGLALRVTCPEQHSLLPEWNNSHVNLAFTEAEKCGVQLDSFQIVAEDWNSDQTDTSIPTWQVLYTTYLQSCSPLHSGDNLQPIPLYKNLRNKPHLAMDAIKWQENWQACDQLQMNAASLEIEALAQISQFDSTLNKHGYHLAQEIEQHTRIPTYYYLYRVGEENYQQEAQLRCPRCHKNWRLDKPLHDIFHFKCDTCRLVANFSWNLL